jgi:hypothetical protein
MVSSTDCPTTSFYTNKVALAHNKAKEGWYVTTYLDKSKGLNSNET